MKIHIIMLLIVLLVFGTACTRIYTSAPMISITRNCSNASSGGGDINGTDIAPSSIWGETSSDAVRIGSITDGTYATTNDDLYVKSVLEVDGLSYFDNTAFFTSQQGVSYIAPVGVSQYELWFDSSYHQLFYKSADTFFDQGLYLISDDIGRQLIIGDKDTYGGADYGLPLQDNPTLVLQATGTAAAHKLLLSHNTTEGVIKSLAGNVTVDSDLKVTGNLWVGGCIQYNCSSVGSPMIISIQLFLNGIRISTGVFLPNISKRKLFHKSILSSMVS